ncbi:MAG: outer membrane protein assembly factor BamC [Pseudomonadales bacterium]|nr:outer membrane protein assembly factor BamC [Pseudomonadales bacterium]MCP5357496.1 outer membrane protein assembly factor BamC [Pseudomonadales bacterium]
MQAFKPVVLSVMVTSILSGCSYLTGDDGYFRDRQGDYLVAPDIAPMDIPPDLDSYTLDTAYVIPDPLQDERPFFLEAPAPHGLDTNVREGVVVQRFGERRWIVIGAEPGQVWPRMRDYWSTAQIRLASEDPIKAIMETVWLGEEGERNKYQVRIEPGLHSGNSEIYVTQVSESYIENPDAPIDWPEDSASQELEYAMLDDISQYLADRTDLYRASSVSLLAGSIEAESKANVMPSAAGDILRIRIDFDRAWSQINQSLNNANILVSDSNRDEGVFTVHYAGDEEEARPGFFRRMFGAKTTAQEDYPTFTVRISEEEGGVVVTAEPVSSDATTDLRNLLVRALHRNLV